MTSDYRTSEFKLGSIHGKSPTDRCREAQLRNHIFGTGNLVIDGGAKLKTRIRIVGYEVPIWRRGKSRDECIDLLGYDETFKPWIIELKRAKSSEKLADVFTQVDRYVKAFDEGIRNAVQDEIRLRFLWQDFCFGSETGKMILADRYFFKNQKTVLVGRSDVLLCSFARYSDEDSLLKSPRNEIRLKIEK